MPKSPHRAFPLILILIAAISSAAIAHTWGIFSQTVDEPIHVAAGLEWWRQATYQLDGEHPPLARILFALPAVLQGVQVDARSNRVEQGNQIFHWRDRYITNLRWARAGNWLFYLLAMAVVAAWGWRLEGHAGAAVAAGLFATLPPILAHASLATTDMAATATTLAALYALIRWIEQPDRRRTLLLAAAMAAGLLSKFSFPVYLVAGSLPLLLLKHEVVESRWRLLLRRMMAIVPLTFLLLWGGYRFSTGSARDNTLRYFPPESDEAIAARYSMARGYEWVRPDIVRRYFEFANEEARRGITGIDFVDWARAAGYPSPLAGRRGWDTMRQSVVMPLPVQQQWLEPLRAGKHWLMVHLPLPAPEYLLGLQLVERHSRLGHPAILFNQLRFDGWWYYFPILLFYKTPLPFLALYLCAGWFAVRRWRFDERAVLTLAPLLMLLPALFSGINIGVRHVLPLYPFMALAAAFAVLQMVRSGSLELRIPAVALCAWQLVAVAAAHPDHLAYFSEAAGRRPYRIALDSNFDWGQDLLRLKSVMQQKGIDQLYLRYFGSADATRLGMNVQPLADGPVRGWIAISEMEWALRGKGLQWLRRHPYERVGKSIRLYRVP